jgi:hypothetical protein
MMTGHTVDLKQHTTCGETAGIPKYKGQQITSHEAHISRGFSQPTNLSRHVWLQKGKPQRQPRGVWTRNERATLAGTYMLNIEVKKV